MLTTTNVETKYSCRNLAHDRHVTRNYFKTVTPFFSAPDDATLNGTGADYLGSLAVTISGRRCLPWNEIAPGLIWAHNYCRNPNGKRDKPWCYIDKNKWEYCNVPEVSAKKGKLRKLFTYF